MLIVSKWKIALDSLILLDFGEWMADEPSLIPSGIVEVCPTLGGSVPLIFPRKNVTSTLSFSRVKNFATDDLARDFLASHASQISASFAGLHTCTIYLNQAVLSHTLVIAGSTVGASGYTARTEASRFVATYTIAGGALTLT